MKTQPDGNREIGGLGSFKLKAPNQGETDVQTMQIQENEDLSAGILQTPGCYNLKEAGIQFAVLLH